MIVEKLGFINEQFAKLDIPYEFLEWSSPVKYPYYVGEITEEPTVTEDGFEESTLIVTGYHRGDAATLEADKEKIKKHFHPINGLHGQTDNGRIVVLFDGAFYIPTGEAGLKRIQINLKIMEWKVY